MRTRRLAAALLLAVLAFTPLAAQVGKGLLDLNTASEKDLLGLPHMTPAIVKQVIDRRPFGSITGLHAHIGSGIHDARHWHTVYAQLASLAEGIGTVGFIDVGGGLGVDYDGSRSAFDSSTNYTLQEYTNDVVYYIADVCNAEKVAHPDIVTEAGRAMVAHHSVLIFDVLGVHERSTGTKPAPAQNRWAKRLLYGVLGLTLVGLFAARPIAAAVRGGKNHRQVAGEVLDVLVLAELRPPGSHVALRGFGRRKRPCQERAEDNQT